MNVKELRIGNWVYCVNGADELFETRITVIGGKLAGDDYWPAYSGIQLTEEWLLKFGFKEYIDFGLKSGTWDLLPLQGFCYSKNTNKIMIMHEGNTQSHWIINPIKHVHQLQNLYFALTGKELEIVVD